ncbi:MAG: hypothetical protein EON96_19085 [Caulobacteraceae bacterium]|nr:MAG: hypothetical protein EON96_19085 [Caulobacteraceae bacterium]
MGRPVARKSLTDEQFAEVRSRFAQLGDTLTDDQLLQLADDYHAMLRWRLNARSRLANHVSLAPRTDGDPIWSPHGQVFLDA